MPAAASFPAPIAKITVAAPVTASPPANTPSLEVCPFSSATIHCHLFISNPLVVEGISGFGDVPNAIITVSTSNSNSEPSIVTGLLLPDSSASPSSILIHLIPLTQPSSFPHISAALVNSSKFIPSALACSTSSALAGISSSDLLYTVHTSAPNLKAVLAASIATFPPPTTATL